MQKLDFVQSLRDSGSICARNAAIILVTILLWLSTIWIPGINIGTTIAVLLLPARLAEGAPIRPFTIFKREYRSRMSDCFLMAGMMAVPILLALTFIFFPGVVLLLAWSLSFNYLLLRDRGPVEAIRASNRATCGSKWAMLFVLLIMACIPALIALLILLCCRDASKPETLSIVAFVFYILLTVVGISVAASFWRQLGGNAE